MIRINEMVVCKVCGHFGKKLTRTKRSKKLRGLCGLKAHTGRMDIEEERECADFTTETIDNLFQ
jgi:hypothetical protein